MTLVTREFLKWNIWGREVIISSVYKHAEDLSPNFYKNKANVKGSGEKNNKKKTKPKLLYQQEIIWKYMCIPDWRFSGILNSWNQPGSKEQN